MIFIGVQPDKNFKKHLEFIEQRDGGIFWLVTRYYMPNITDMQKEAIIYIESGIWKDMSIGFRAPLKFAIFENGKEVLVNSNEFREMGRDEDESILFLEFRNEKDLEAEALEGSHVFLGSQIGAQTTKAADALQEQIKQLNNKIDKVMTRLSRKKKSVVVEPEPEIDVQPNVAELQSDDITVDSISDVVDSDKEVPTGDMNDEVVNFDNDNVDEVDIGDWIAIDTIEDAEIKYYVQALDELIVTENEDFAKLSDTEKTSHLKAVWTTAYINTLNDNCFAYIEKTGKQDNENRTIPKKARHLPHHPKGGGASGVGGIIDLPHLRNALARVGQVNPVTDKISADGLRAQAKSHLVAHAKKLNIGDYEIVYDTIRRDAGNDQAGENGGDSEIENNAVEINNVCINEEKVMEFKFDLFGVNHTVNDEKFDETMKVLNDALVAKETELHQNMANLTQKVSDFEDKAAVNEEAINALTEQNEKLEGFAKSVKEVFGEDVTIEALKRAKDTEKAHRESVITKSLKFGGFMGMIKDEKKELESYEGWTTDQIAKFADKYEADFYAAHPEFEGVLKSNDKVILTVTDDPEPVKVELEEPLQHYRW